MMIGLDRIGSVDGSEDRKMDVDVVCGTSSTGVELLFYWRKICCFSRGRCDRRGKAGRVVSVSGSR